MDSLRAKLKSNSGESLAEVLIALLVSALALVMLASMISSSFSIIKSSRAKLKDYYEDSTLASPSGSTVVVSVKADSTVLDSYNVICSAGYEDLGREEICAYVPA